MVLTRRFIKAGIAAALAVAGLSLLLWASSARAEGRPSEYALKAAFLYRFAQFVDWPARDAGRPFVIGVVGRDPFGEEIDALRSETVRGRPIEIRRLNGIQKVPECDMVYVGETASLDVVFAAAAGRPILTIGETDHFARQGGMIGFMSIGNKIRFVINKGRAEKAGIRISSQLFSLAAAVIQ